MNKKQVLVVMYIAMTVLYAAGGLLMVLAPSWWLPVLPFSFVQTGGNGWPIISYFVRLLGLAYLAQAPLFFWCATNPKKRRKVHLALTVFVLGQLLLDVMVICRASSIPTAGFWLPFLLVVLIPGVFMALASVPPLPRRPKGPREMGQVKWFNASKGFGFVTRSQGDDVFVHYRSIRGEGHRTLREGQQVEFVVVKGEKGLQAEDVLPL